MFHCLPESAWADGNLTESAGHLGKMMEHRNRSQPNPGLGARGTPCKWPQPSFQTRNSLTDAATRSVATRAKLAFASVASRVAKFTRSTTSMHVSRSLRMGFTPIPNLPSLTHPLCFVGDIYSYSVHLENPKKDSKHQHSRQNFLLLLLGLLYKLGLKVIFLHQRYSCTVLFSSPELIGSLKLDNV